MAMWAFCGKHDCNSGNVGNVALRVFGAAHSKSSSTLWRTCPCPSSQPFLLNSAPHSFACSNFRHKSFKQVTTDCTCNSDPFRWETACRYPRRRCCVSGAKTSVSSGCKKYVIDAGSMHTRMWSLAARAKTSGARRAFTASIRSTGCRWGERHTNASAKSFRHSFMMSVVTHDDFLLQRWTLLESDPWRFGIALLGSTMPLPKNTCASLI